MEPWKPVKSRTGTSKGCHYFLGDLTVFLNMFWDIPGLYGDFPIFIDTITK